MQYLFLELVYFTLANNYRSSYQPKHKKVYFLCNIVYCPCVLFYVRQNKRNSFFTFWLPRDPVILRMEEERKKKNKKKGESYNVVGIILIKMNLNKSN